MVLRAEQLELAFRHQSTLEFTRQAFLWQEPLHALVQHRLPSSDDGAVVFRSVGSGACLGLSITGARACDLLGAGYLEMARAACSSIELSTTSGAAELEASTSQPLFPETAGVQVECAISVEGRFDVRSGETASDTLEDAIVHCSGMAQASSNGSRPRFDGSLVRAERSEEAAQVLELSLLPRSGSQYGPAFSVLSQKGVYGQERKALARLEARSTASTRRCTRQIWMLHCNLVPSCQPTQTMARRECRSLWMMYARWVPQAKFGPRLRRGTDSLAVGLGAQAEVGAWLMDSARVLRAVTASDQQVPTTSGRIAARTTKAPLLVV